MDHVVMIWLYGTISPTLRRSSRRFPPLPTSSSLFQNASSSANVIEQRALYLNATFWNFMQGDLSITDYCRKFKSMADALGDLG
jgi:hypothetical protein